MGVRQMCECRVMQFIAAEAKRLALVGSGCCVTFQRVQSLCSVGVIAPVLTRTGSGRIGKRALMVVKRVFRTTKFRVLKRELRERLLLDIRVANGDRDLQCLTVKVKRPRVIAQKVVCVSDLAES